MVAAVICPESSASLSGSRCPVANCRSRSASVSRSLAMRSAPRPSLRTISSSSRRMARTASSSALRASGPLSVMIPPLPLRHRPAEHRDQVVEIDEPLLLEAHHIVLDDAVILLVGDHRIIDRLRHPQPPLADRLGRAGLLIGD